MLELNKIYCIDAIEGLSQLDDNSVDLVVTDPPYRLHAKSSGGLHKNRQWLQKIHDNNLDNFEPQKYLEIMIKKIKIVNMYIFCSKNLLKEYIEFADVNHFNWDILIMSKRNPIPTKNNKYLSDVEYCMFMRESGAYFNSNLDYSKYFKVKPITVTKNTFHPAEKPLNFIKDIIQVSSRENDLILDPFIGSGTTAVACKQLNRNFIGFDNKLEYVEVANKRISKVQIAMFV